MDGSLPSRERELKPYDALEEIRIIQVAPFAGARVETVLWETMIFGGFMSLPSRERELKQVLNVSKQFARKRRSLRGSAS